MCPIVPEFAHIFQDGKTNRKSSCVWATFQRVSDKIRIILKLNFSI